MPDNEQSASNTGNLTLNGRLVSSEKLEEQKKLAEKTGAKIVETSPGNYKIPLND